MFLKSIFMQISAGFFCIRNVCSFMCFSVLAHAAMEHPEPQLTQAYAIHFIQMLAMLLRALDPEGIYRPSTLFTRARPGSAMMCAPHVPHCSMANYNIMIVPTESFFPSVTSVDLGTTVGRRPLNAVFAARRSCVYHRMLSCPNLGGCEGMRAVSLTAAVGSGWAQCMTCARYLEFDVQPYQRARKRKHDADSNGDGGSTSSTA